MSSVYPDQDLPEVIGLSTIHTEVASLWCNRNVDRKGKIYLCAVGNVVSPVGVHAHELLSPTHIRADESKADQAVATANKAERHSPVGVHAHELLSPTHIRADETKEDQAVATANKAERHIKESHRSNESFMRIVLRSVPFFAFIVIATRLSEIANWTVKEKSLLLVLVAALFVASIYAWWPRSRQ